MPTLHGHPVSQPCRSIQWFIDYSGVDCEVKTVNLMGGEHKSPEFVAKFPNGQVPAFEDGDLCFGESIAILQYLADGSDILPSDSDKKAKARLQEYFGRHLSQVRKFSREIIFPFFFEKDAEEKKKKIAAGIEATKPMMTSFETHFEKNKFVLGDTLSLADFMFAPEVDQLFLVGYDYGKNVAAYLERLKEVKGYTKMMEGMQAALKAMADKK